jgi:hypothetical protein
MNKENGKIFVIAIVAAIIVGYFLVRGKIPVVNSPALTTATGS